MQNLQSQPITRVKTLLLLSILKQPDATVSQHTIAIHQEQLDARCTLLDVGSHRTSNSSMPASFKPAGVFASINTAVPAPAVPSLLRRICTSAAIRFALICSVRTTFVSHDSV